MTIFSNLSILFFKANDNKKFNKNKSILENFTNMCRLPFVKPDSKETLNLKEVLKKCNLVTTKTKDKEELNDYIKCNIAILEVAKSAIELWELKREGKSSRCNDVANLKKAIMSQQTDLKSQYDKAFSYINSMPAPLRLHYMKIKQDKSAHFNQKSQMKLG